MSRVFVRCRNTVGNHSART